VQGRGVLAQGRTFFPVEYSSAPIFDSGVVGAVVTFRDITLDREVNRMKNEFISLVSHELRTPLTSIRGSLGLLAGGVFGSLSEKGQRMLDIAVSNTDRLVRLINDILDIERIDSGKIGMTLQSLFGLEPGLADLGQPPSHGRQGRRGTRPERGRRAGHGGCGSHRTTLTNLVANAIKFSSTGHNVWITVSTKDREALFQVRDEGRGIPQDKLGLVFERFSRWMPPTHATKGAAGLGLTICRSIVTQHGGRIWVESRSGQGSTVQFHLPRSDVSPSRTLTTPEVPLLPLVLLCDVDHSLEHSVAAILKRRGFQLQALLPGEDVGGGGKNAQTRSRCW